MQIEHDLQLKRHLKAWANYERVRQRGLFNMLDERNVTAHAAISSYEYHFILTHYEELRDLYNETVVKDKPTIAKKPVKPTKHISLEDQIGFVITCEKTAITQYEKDHFKAILQTLKRLPKGAD